MAEIYGFAINVSGNAVQSITAIDSKLEQLGKNAQKSDSVFAGLFKFEALKQGLGLLASGFSEVYNFGKQMEQTMLSFEVMTGSKEKAHQLQVELKHLADISPMVDSAIYGGGKMLLNYGIEANKVGGYLNMLGDISAGDADRFQRLAYVFGQVSAQTKLQGADLRQMIDAGFNPLNEMVKTTGKSYEQLKDDMSKGKISFDMVVNAMKSVTGEGGRFNNMMQRQAETVGGMESTFTGTLQSGMYGIFQRLSPVLKDVLGASTAVAQSFADWVTPKQSEILGDQRAEMMAMFEVLKNGNLPLDQRRELINKINTEYKDYLPNIITEKTSIGEIAAFQGIANQKMLEKIKITAQEEILSKYFKEAAKAQEDVMKAQIEYEKHKNDKSEKTTVGAIGATITTNQGDYWKATIKNRQEEANKAQAELEKVMKSITKDTEANISLNIKTKGLNATAGSAMDMLKSKSDIINQNTAGAKMGAERALVDNAASTSAMAAGGGLGQAKVINMNFNQPLMQINAGSIDGQDMNDNAEKVVEQLTRELHNIAYEQGIM